MSGDRGHHPVSLPEIRPRHQGPKITQRWTWKSPRPTQSRPAQARPPGAAPQPPPATAAEGAAARPKARRANQSPQMGRGARPGAPGGALGMGCRGPVRPDRVRGPGIYPCVSLTAAAGAQSAGGRVGAGLCVTQIWDFSNVF